MKNPYILGRIVLGTEFYGRQEIVQELLDPGRTQIYLMGNRRIGKTSLLMKVKALTPEVALYISLHGSNFDYLQMGRDAGRAVEGQVKEYPLHQDALKAAVKEAAGDLCTLIESLGQAADKSGFRILLILDEAGELLGLQQSDLNRLHRAIEDRTHVRTILAATRELEELYTRETAPNTIPFLQGFQIIYLPPLTDEESRDLISQTVDGKLRVQADEKLIKQICTATGGQPYLLQFLCYRLFVDGHLRPIYYKKDLHLEFDLRNYCQKEHAVLSPSERVILSWLAQKRALDCQTLARLCGLPTEVVDDYLFILELLGNISVHKKLYRVSNAFMNHWLLIEALMKNPSLVSDQVSREIAEQVPYQAFDESEGFGQKQKVSDLSSHEATKQARLQGFKTSLVRILDTGKNPVGVGFLVRPNRVLTCAHVVAAALGKMEIPEKMPETKIRLDFPLLAPDTILDACVVGWQPPVEQDHGDIATLELCGTIPEKASPAKLVKVDAIFDDQFRAFGFPVNHKAGVWVSGRVVGAITGGRVQIEAVSQTGYFIQPGFSGGPVWAEKLNGIVGMVVAVESSPDIRVAYMIPYDLFAALIVTPMLDDTKQV